MVEYKKQIYNGIKKELKIKPIQVFANESCGFKCLKLLFNYYHVDFSIIGDSLSKLQKFSSPVWITDLGKLALDLGFEVSIFTYSSTIFEPAWLSTNQFQFERLLAQSKTKNVYLNQARKSILKFIKSGGKLHRKIINPLVIKSYLKKQHPVLLAVSSAVIHQTSMTGGHFIVVQGYCDRNFIILNPQRQAFKKEIINQDRLLYALYQWGSWAMVLRKKKN